MTTFNTGNPIGSTDARDRSDNSENLDLAVNSLALTFEDRLGVTRDTLEGVYQKSAYYRAGTFDTGYTLTNNRQTLAYGNIEYSWSGSFPKVVAATSTPETTGGIGAVAWVDRTDITLRSDLEGDNGGSLVFLKPSTIASAIKRSISDVIYSQIIDVTWFAPAGFIPNWNAQTQTGNDYTTAIQSAINHYATIGNKRAGGTRAIMLPAGNYKFSSLTLPSAMGFGIDFIGDGKHSTVLWADPADASPAITGEIEFVNFRGMSLFGALSETSNNANWKACFYKGKLASNLADVDVRFSDCIVGYAASFVQAYGRGVIFDQGTIAVYCTNLLEIVADASTIFTGSTNDKTTTGMRHYSFLGVRADVVSRIVKITGTAVQKDHIHGIQINGCDFAACDRLIEGIDATIRGPVIANNHSLDSFAGGVVTVRSATNALDIGNVWRNLHDESVLPTANSDCIQWVWDISGAAAGLSVIGTNASNIRSGIVRTGSASINVQINDCQFPQFATFNGGDANHWVYNSPANCDGLQITGNQFTAGAVAGTYKLYDETVQTSNKTKARDNTAPFTWADQRLRYTPSLLVGGVASVPTGTPSYYARIGEITQNHVTVDAMMAIDPSETSGVLAISLPTAFPAIAENATITGSYSGWGSINQASGFSGTTAPFAPLRVNASTQQAEIWLGTGPSGTQANASHTSGVISLFFSFRYRYA